MSSVDMLYNNNVEELLVLTSPFDPPRRTSNIRDVIASTRTQNKDVSHDSTEEAKSRRQRLHYYGNKKSKHSKALLNALTSNDSDYLRTLLNDGINPNLKLINYETMYTMTALHFAVERADMEMVDVLVNSGADLDALDGDGRAPIDITCRMKDHRFVMYLVHHGCSLLKDDTRVICLGMAFHRLIHGLSTGRELYPTIKALLDTGLIRGWNGINDSVAYVNHVYQRDKTTFGLLFQAAQDIRDLGFITSSQEVMRRRRDHHMMEFFVRHGYKETQKTLVAPSLSDPKKFFQVPCLQGLCRVAVRRHFRSFPGKMSTRIKQLEIPKSLKHYIDFLDLSLSKGKT